MNPHDALARVLIELIHAQSITRSAIGRRARRSLEPLFQSGAVREERSGGGWRVHVVNREAVERFSDALYPKGLFAGMDELNRAEAVAVLRNAKRGANRSGEPVLIRGFSAFPFLSSPGELDVRGMTQLCGAACFVLRDEQTWSYHGKRVALVENLEPFLRFEERFNDFDAAIYCAGRISERLLQWLETQSFDVVHFGDYDPVGLQEYIKIKKSCMDRAALYIPENLEALVKRYGKHALLRDSSAVLAGLRKSNDESVIKVLECLEDLGLGLEQEILWATLEDEEWHGG